MFLFDQSNNGRQNYNTGNSYRLLWKTFLNTNPVFGAESSPVFDPNGNLYFGSHSGNFYSLNRDGNIRWTFSTRKKIYSSPVIIDNKLLFCGGDGFLYCLSKNGDLIWHYDITGNSNINMFSRYLKKLIHLPFTFSIIRKKNVDYGSWSSPNYYGNYIYVTGFGKGLFCIDINGNVIWSYDLGYPRDQLSGVTVDVDKGLIFGLSRKGYAYCFTVEGDLVWKKLIKLFYEPWAHPVLYKNKKYIIYITSLSELSGLLTALDYDGKEIWRKKINAARGSCAINDINETGYYSDLDGFIHKIDLNSGKLINKVKLSNAQLALWTTPTLEKNGDILISIKDSSYTGRVVKLNENLSTIWEFTTGKVLSIPVIDSNGKVYFGSWDGYFYCLETN